MKQVRAMSAVTVCRGSVATLCVLVLSGVTGAAGAGSAGGAGAASAQRAVAVPAPAPILSPVDLLLAGVRRPQSVKGVVTGTITPGGPPVALTISNPGDTGALTFSGTAGERVFVSFTSDTIGSGCCSTQASLRNPSGQSMKQTGLFGPSTSYAVYLDTTTLPTAGTYTIQINPQNNAIGSITTTLYDVPADVTASVTPAQGGASATLTTTAVGQNGSVTFSGTTGERVFVNFTNSSFAHQCDGNGSILNPSGSVVGGSVVGHSGTVCVGGSGNSYIDITTLQQNGTFSVFFDPTGLNIGSITVTVYQVPADATGLLAIGGAPLALSMPNVGQNASATFSGQAGQPITLTTSNDTIGSGGCATQITIKKPDGSTLGGANCVSTSGSTITATLTVAGTYSIFVDPQALNTGSITLALNQGSAFEPLGQATGCGEGGLLGVSLAKCWGATLSEPVDTLTGAFETQVTDVSLPGVGVPFAFTRSYSSADATSGRLGPGWTDSVGASLIVQQNGDVLVHAENGQQVYYAKQQDGSFVGAAGAQAALSTIGGGYQLVRNDQLTYTFDTQGRLSSVKDRNSQGLTLSYNGSGQLASVTDATGRQITLAYNASNLLSQLSVPDGRSVSYAYTSGRLSSVTDVLGHTTSYTYDANGRLATIVDPLGHTTVQNTYDASGRVSQQKDALNNTSTFSWNSSTQTETVTDPRGNSWQDVYANNVLLKRIDAQSNATQFADDAHLNGTSVTGADNKTVTMSYDASGNLTSATSSALGATKTLAYNARNDVTSVTDARGKVTTSSYDANGNLTQVVEDGTTVAQYAYNAQGERASSTDGRGNTTTYAYDANGNLSSVTDPLNHTTSYTYDSAGRQTSVTDPLNHTTSFTYDAAGRLLTTTDPLNHTTTYTYDAAGNRTSVSDANNHTTTYAYDADNRVSSVTAPNGGVTSYNYDTAGNTLTQTDPLNHATTYTYDSDNRLANVTDPLGNKTTFSYDTVSNLTKTVDPRGNVQGANPNDYAISSTYDAAGRLLTQTDPLGNTTTYTYDKDGNKTSVKDANNHTTSYAYDGLGRLTTVTAPDGGVTSYTYDAASNLLSRTDANGHATSYSYDADNRLTSKTLPLNRQWTYSYDAAANRTSIVDANGTTSYSYDAANHQTGISYSDSTPSVSYGYDAVGNRASMTDGAGTQSYSYDAANRLTGVSRGADSFAYTYDLAGNITRRTYPDGTIVDYSYDADNNIASVTSGGQTTSYSYDPASELTQTTLPSGNGYVETRTYDHAARLTEVKNASGSSVLSDYAATLDAVGNPTTIVRSGATSSTATYGYDANDRLTSVCFQSSCPGGSDPFIRWTYDQVGNRLTEARPSGTTTSTYNAADELTAAGSTSYSYDQNGNETAAGNRTFSYDLADRLTSTSDGSTTTTYSYDGDSNRLQASTGSSPSQKTNYLWDTNNGLPQIAIERDGSGALLRRYLYGNRRISMTTPAGTYYYHYDQLGSVSELTSASGATEWTYAYEPFGTTRTATQNDPNAPSNPMQFAGELSDPTGLYYLRARQYDPAMGRFAAPDSVEPATGTPYFSSYAYVADQPTTRIDPTGKNGQRLFPCDSGMYAALVSSPSSEAFRGPAVCGVTGGRGNGRSPQVSRDPGAPSAGGAGFPEESGEPARGGDYGLGPSLQEILKNPDVLKGLGPDALGQALEDAAPEGWRLDPFDPNNPKRIVLWNPKTGTSIVYFRSNPAHFDGKPYFKITPAWKGTPKYVPAYAPK